MSRRVQELDLHMQLSDSSGSSDNEDGEAGDDVPLSAVEGAAGTDSGSPVSPENDKTAPTFAPAGSHTGGKEEGAAAGAFWDTGGDDSDGDDERWRRVQKASNGGGRMRNLQRLKARRRRDTGEGAQSGSNESDMEDDPLFETSQQARGAGAYVLLDSDDE